MTATVTGQRRVERCMGTVFSFDVRSPGVARSALDEAVAWLHWVDATFSTYRADSQVSRLARGALALPGCAPDVAAVLERCELLRQETDGYFSAYAGGDLDPSGYVKGWAIKRASDILAAAGSTSHCVNGGGDVQCVGEAAPETPWRIGVAHPLTRGDLAAVVAGDGIAVATSGSAERGSHLLDPHTRRSPCGLTSVTVVGRHLATADAYATAAFAMGTAARDWLEQLSGHWGFVVDADGGTWASTGWGTDVH